MRIPSKGRYAVAALIDLSMKEAEGPLTIAEIAENQSISLSYLEQLFADMRNHGLIKGTRGPGGGYRLARDAQDISVADVIEAVDERTVYRMPEHETYEPFMMWEGLSQRLYDYLNGISIADCVAQRELLTSEQKSDSGDEDAGIAV
jgi:Rrf2 family iron-sulfur cluster assembly transcriptional regulator